MRRAYVGLRSNHRCSSFRPTIATLCAPIFLGLTSVLWAASTDGAASQISAQLNNYLRSIDAADLGLAATVWDTADTVSMIHPRGHQRGWQQISQDFYIKSMAAPFRERKLKCVGIPEIQVYGDSAVVTFYWEFAAVLKSTGAAVNERGRETQVYVQLPKKGWRLVHVHYSGPPLGR